MIHLLQYNAFPYPIVGSARLIEGTCLTQYGDWILLRYFLDSVFIGIKEVQLDVIAHCHRLFLDIKRIIFVVENIEEGLFV